MENINIEKEVCQLAQAFYTTVIRDRSSHTICSDSQTEIMLGSLKEASKLVQAKLLSVSLNNISESLFHIGNRIYVEPPKFKNLRI
jgi:hypothetical protein